MYHKHFNTIDSTQIYLKENLDELKLNDNNILISCSNQTKGIGRTDNVWDFYSNSIAISFTLSPHKTPSLTPLEIGLLTINFILKKYKKEIFLKWPNDLMTKDGKKCGGILCQYIDKSTVIVGLGINLGQNNFNDKKIYPHGFGSVDQDLVLEKLDYEKISNELYCHFLGERIIEVEDLKSSFLNNCLHINKEVLIHDGEGNHIGIFKGIGNNGEALVEINLTIQKFFSSSLTILN